MPESYDTVPADMVTVAREAGALTQSYFKRFRDLEIGIKEPAGIDQPAVFRVRPRDRGSNSSPVKRQSG
jgi:hypothetical protein